MFQIATTTTTTTGLIPQRLIDPNAIDITSLKGRFAWEKIPLGDIYIPVIFRGDTKYFCVRMLRGLLIDYPEDILRRSVQFQYHKTIDLYHVTSNEIELLNRINFQHARCFYSRQPFTALDEIVRVTDFFPFYEHLRLHFKSGTSALQAIDTVVRQLLPPTSTSLPIRRSAPINHPPLPSAQLIPTSSLPRQPYPSAVERYLANPPPIHKRSALPAPSILRTTTRPIRPVITNTHSVPVTLAPTTTVPIISPSQTHIQSLSLPPPSLLHPPSICPPPTVVPTAIVRTASHGLALSPIVTPSNTPIGSSAVVQSDSLSSSSLVELLSNIPSTSSSPILPGVPITQPKKTSPTSKTSRLYSGWIQINKLYTPYVTSSTTDHHQYKIPVSLLGFYDLINLDEPTAAFEQSSVSSEELDLINDLCTKHSIRPFAADTKMIDLATFYRYCSANIIFIKELPINEPKSSICKDWLSVVQINGGICRLRNINSLHEQTVPFIGNNLLKSFIVSSHCLHTATLTKPIAMEFEFLQMILFFSNLPTNLRNAQLIDLDSVKKEYTVDLILLFNDKFPLNILDYQQQGTRTHQPSTSAAKNPIAESTPPPSPPSPPTNSNPTPSAQLPLTSSTNRYHKTIEFHGHSLTAYICSGLGSNAQRECVSIKSLCQIICPNVSTKDNTMEKLEMKMLRLLRAKNINRYRPQNQQSMGFTRLIDIRDAEKYWNYLEKGMLSTNLPDPSVAIARFMKSAGKRLISDDEERLEEEDVPVLERLNKRLRLNEKEKENNEEIPEISLSALSNEPVTETTESIPTAMQVEPPLPEVPPTLETTETTKTLPKSPKKIRTPANQSKTKTLANWVKKYQLEDCCVCLDLYQIPVDS